MTNPSDISSDIGKLPKGRQEGPASNVAQFVRDHPGLVVAGGLALGLVAGGLLARGSGSKLAKRAVSLAEIAGTAGLAFGRDALERAEDAGGELRKQGGALAGKAGVGLRKQRDALTDKAGQLAGPAEDALDTAHDAASRLLRKAFDLAGKLRH